MADQKIACFRCNHNWTFTPPLGRASECPECQADARVCRNCQYFDAAAHKQCREPQADDVQDKERSNFCGYFQSACNLAERQSELGESRQGLAKLFNDSSLSADDHAKTTSSLDEQFGDFLKKTKPTK